MKFEVKTADNNVCMLAVKIEPEELTSVEDNVIRDIRKKAVIPGFRKGRVPASLVKKQYRNLIKMELVEQAINKYYNTVLDQADIKPISQGKVTNVNFENISNGLEFEIEIDVEPEIELKKYKGLKVEKEIPPAADSFLEKALENLREKFATVKSADIIEEGYLVKFNAQELEEGNIPVIGQKHENIEVKIGSGEFDKELEMQLIGLKVNEEAVVAKQRLVPDGGKGTPAIENYKINIVSIEEYELPPLDDELAKNLQEDNIETLDQLKEDFKNKIENDLTSRSVQQFNSRLIDELLKENPFDVPQVMLDNYFNNFINDLNQRYPNEKIDPEMVREKYRTDAIHYIRWYLLKQKIADVENVAIPDSDLFQKIDQMNLNDDVKAQMKQNAPVLEKIREDLRDEKVLKLVEENAEITEIYPQSDPVEEVAP